MDVNKNSENVQNKEPIEKALSFQQIRAYFGTFIWDIIDLEKGVDKAATIEEIKNKKSMAGANAWMLMCSIMIASLGLDRNSPAVIIGAMLISPLMSPILGLGLGVGINDRSVIRESLMHFLVAIFIAILSSTIYFILTPLGDLTPEIIARTEPTVLDVLIAFFGGIAGIISIARKDISTTIPGVAIATALMPPLCVTGYGIANLNSEIILHSFYLFFSNTFFIVLSTYLIVRLLNFPFRKYMNKKQKRRNKIYVMIFSLLVMIPSFFIMRKVIRSNYTTQKIKTFITQEFGEERRYLEDYLVIQTDTLNELILKVYGTSESKSYKQRYQESLEKIGLEGWKVSILPTSEVNLDRVARLETQIDDTDKMFSHIDSLQGIKSQQQSSIDLLKTKLRESMLDTVYFNDICMKTKERFPDLQEISIGQLPYQDFATGANSSKDIVIIKWNEDVDKKSVPALEKNLQFYLEGSLNKDKIHLFAE